MAGAPAASLDHEETLRTEAMNLQAATRKDTGSLTLCRLHTSLEWPLSGHFMTKMQTCISFPLLVWIFLFLCSQAQF